MTKISIIVLQMMLTVILSGQVEDRKINSVSDQSLREQIVGTWKLDLTKDSSIQISFSRDGQFVEKSKRKDGSAHLTKGEYRVEGGTLTMSVPKTKESLGYVYKCQFPYFKIENSQLWLPPGMGFGATHIYKRAKE